jgi:hypothetical protein
MKLVTRQGWGARAPHRSPVHLIPSALRGVAVHYTGMDSDEQADHARCAARIRAIQNFHMDDPEREWNDIAYNFLVCKHGYVFEGRGWLVRSAGQGTNPGNDGYHAVCFLGDDTKGRDDVTDPGRRALGAIIRAAQTRFPAAAAVEPHSFFHTTACPGADLRLWIEGRGWRQPPHLRPRAIDWKWARWYLGLGEYEQVGRRHKPSRPRYPRLVPARGWAAERWYIAHVLRKQP